MSVKYGASIFPGHIAFLCGLMASVPATWAAYSSRRRAARACDRHRAPGPNSIFTASTGLLICGGCHGTVARVVVNTSRFGKIARAARGARTQDEIDVKGGPPRQRQAVIERGDPVDLSPAVLAQLDTAYGWSPGAAELLLTRQAPPLHLYQRLAALSPTAIGVTPSGSEITLPPVLATTSASQLLPLIRRWPGPVLIDRRVDIPLDDLLPATGHNGKQVHRTGCTNPENATPIAIDPISVIGSYRHAVQLLTVMDHFRAGDPPNRARALTLLFLAAETRRTGDGLAALTQFAETTQYPTQESHQRWLDFYHASNFSSRMLNPYNELPSDFEGILALRDSHLEVALVEQPDGALLPAPHATPTILPITDLDNMIVAYNSSLCPALPAILDWAYQGRRTPAPLLIVEGPYRNSHWQKMELANSHLIIVDDAADLDSPADTAPGCARLTHVTDHEPAVLVPPLDRPNDNTIQLTRIWLPTVAGRIVSHQIRESGDGISFYRRNRDKFSDFHIANILRENNAPGLILIDSDGNELHFWELPSGYQGSGPEEMATILAEAGFGTKHSMDQLTGPDLKTWPRTIYRPIPNLRLPTNNDAPAIELPPNSQVFIGGADSASRSTTVTAMLTKLCAERTPNELNLLAVTTKQPENWAFIADKPHTLTIARPFTETHKSVDILRWFTSTLNDEIQRRHQLLSAANVTDFRQFSRLGYGTCPKLLVVINEVPEAITPSHRELIERVKGLDIHYMFVTDEALPAGAQPVNDDGVAAVVERI